MTGRLDGRVAVVTGSGQSIGRAVAELLALEGASVVVNSRTETSPDDTPTAADTVRDISAQGGRATAVFADVATMEGAQQAVEAAVTTFGRLDILVNNAGGGGVLSTIEALAEPDWDAVILANLKSQYACTHFAVPHLVKGGGGRIVNVGSIVGLLGMSQMTAYAAAKGGVLGLTMALAHELASSGITVNCVLPSAATDRNNRTRTEREALTGVVVPLTPDRVPEAVAPLIAFLATDAAEQISGQVFDIAAGRITQYLWPPVTRTLFKPGRWTLAELENEFPSCFGTSSMPAPILRSPGGR